MLTRFEHFAVTDMLGGQDSPPRNNGSLCFAQDWERTAFGMALALSRDGHFEWDDFRRNLIGEIDGWEKSHAFGDPSWNYYEQFLTALERTVREAGLVK
jgi:nitrile hydratase accessory protein